MTKEDVDELRKAALQAAALVQSIVDRDRDWQAAEQGSLVILLDGGRRVSFEGEMQEALRRVVRSFLKTQRDDLQEQLDALHYPPEPKKAKVR